MSFKAIFYFALALALLSFGCTESATDEASPSIESSPTRVDTQTINDESSAVESTPPASPATPTIHSSRGPGDGEGTATATGASATATPGCSDDNMTLVQPRLEMVEPAEVRVGEEFTLSGYGGYLHCNGAYNESARLFDLTLDGEPFGTILCYVNYCNGTFVIPAGTTPGEYFITVDGGTSVPITVLE